MLREKTLKVAAEIALLLMHARLPQFGGSKRARGIAKSSGITRVKHNCLVIAGAIIPLRRPGIPVAPE
jgi:hypothetical protein